MKALFVYFALFFLIVSRLNGQGFLNVKGVVLDSLTQNPVQNAWIGIAAKGISIISNEEGKFIFKYPAINQKSKITIAAIGYKNLELNLADSSFINRDSLFLVKSPPIILDTAYTNHFKAKWVVNDALLRVKANAQSNNYMLNGFYQETLFRDSMYVKIYEGMLKVEKSPTLPKVILEDFQQEKVKMVKARKYEKTDYTEELSNFGFANGPSIVGHSIEISLPEYLEGNNLDDYEYKLDSLLEIYDNKILWKIKFEPVANRKVKASRIGSILIDTLSKAIVKIEYRFTPEGAKDVLRGSLKSILGGMKTEIGIVYGASVYKSFGDKYYLQDSQLALEAVLKKGKNFKTTAKLNLHFICNEILMKYSSIKFEDILASTDDFPMGGKRYEDSIWGNMNYKIPINAMREIIIEEKE